MESPATQSRHIVRAIVHFARRWWPEVLAGFFTLGVWLVTRRHEMWRDEIQAWLIARDSPTFGALLANMKYEGHPVLWHSLLWMITRVTVDPLWMQVLHVIIAGCSVWLLLRYSPFPVVVRVLIPLGYFFAYEWGVIARNYGLSVLLLFVICVVYKERWRRFPVLAILVALLSQTNIYGIILGTGLTVMGLIEFSVICLRRLPEVRCYRRRVALGFGVAIAALASSVYLIWQPADSGFATKWYFRWTQQRREDTARAVVNAFLPVPVERREFWGSNRFVEPSQRIPVALCILGLTGLFFFKRPWLLVPLGFGYLGVLSFMYLKLPGGIRHHGFLYLLLIVLLWLSSEYTPWRLAARVPERWLAGFDRYRYYALVPLLLLHILGTWTAVRIDWKEPFSQASAAARWLRERYRDTSQIVFVGDHSPEVSAVVGQVPLKKIFYPDRGEYGSFVIWDNRRNGGGEPSLVNAVNRLAAATTNQIVIISNYRLHQRNFHRVQSFVGAIVDDERYYIYEWTRPASE